MRQQNRPKQTPRQCMPLTYASHTRFVSKLHLSALSRKLCPALYRIESPINWLMSATLSWSPLSLCCRVE